MRATLFFSPFDNSLEFVCGVNRFEPHFIRIANVVLYANRRFGENARHIVEYRTHQIKRTNVFVLAIWYWVWNRICVCTIWVICLYAMTLVTNRCILSRSHVMYARANWPNWSSATAIQSQVYISLIQSQILPMNNREWMRHTFVWNWAFSWLNIWPSVEKTYWLSTSCSPMISKSHIIKFVAFILDGFFSSVDLYHFRANGEKKSRALQNWNEQTELNLCWSWLFFSDCQSSIS